MVFGGANHMSASRPPEEMRIVCASSLETPRLCITTASLHEPPARSNKSNASSLDTCVNVAIILAARSRSLILLASSIFYYMCEQRATLSSILYWEPYTQ